MEKNLTTGSVFKNLVVFSLPYLLSFCLQTLYGMADLFIIGQYEGVAATTAVSVGSQVMHMLTVMIVGLAMGTTVSIGQAVGAGDRRRAAQDVGLSLIHIFGRRRLKELRRDMQLIFQDPFSSLNPKLTISQAIDEALALTGKYRDADERFAKVLELSLIHI